jgi:hypothetical protein
LFGGTDVFQRSACSAAAAAASRQPFRRQQRDAIAG